MLINIILTILIGALVGWLAGQIMHTKGSGFWFNCLLGVIGSGLGRFLAALIGITAKRVSIGGILISVAGACLAVRVVRKIAKKV